MAGGGTRLLKRKRVLSIPSSIPVEPDDEVGVPVDAVALERSQSRIYTPDLTPNRIIGGIHLRTRARMATEDILQDVTTPMSVDGVDSGSVNVHTRNVQTMRGTRGIRRVRTRGGRQGRIDIAGTSRGNMNPNLEMPVDGSGDVDIETVEGMQVSANEIQEGTEGAQQVRQEAVHSVIDVPREHIGENVQSMQTNDGHIGNENGRGGEESNVDVESPPVHVQSMQSADVGHQNLEGAADMDSVPGEGNVTNELRSANTSCVKKERIDQLSQGNLMEKKSILGCLPSFCIRQLKI